MFSRLTTAQRTYVVVGLALLLPALATLMFAIYSSYRDQVATKRDEAVDAADDLLMLADARARSDLNVLRVLSRARPFRDPELDLAAGRARAVEAVDLVEGWRAVILSDLSTGNIAFEASPGGAPDGRRFMPDLSGNLTRGAFGGVVREGDHCPCVQLSIRLAEHDQMVLTALVDPDVYFQILRAGLPGDAVGAIVDREGKFLARSIDQANRVGTPATSYVLGAVERGGRGFYSGLTFEGLANYTAYATSDLTGWSSHVAIEMAALDAPMRRANTVLLGGALLATATGALLFLVALRDIAIRRQETERLLELQRAEAVSHFTATVIHDFRNILATIVSGLRLIKRQTQNADIKSHVTMIEDSVERGSRLANQLLSFSHADGAETDVVSVQSLFEDMEYMIGQAVGPGVRVILNTPADEISLSVNRDQLELALLNLALNAKEAMNGRGLLRFDAVELEGFVELQVADTGPGVPEQRRQRIFSAFETDKPKGTGLGLAQVAGMAQQAGGRAHVRAAETGGACFVITLPKATNVAAPQFSQLA